VRGLVFGFALLAAPAMADQSWASFFDAPGAEVERTEDATRETVRLPGDVVVLRQKDQGGWTYSGIDRSPHGAVACMSRILFEIKAVSAQCEGTLSQDNITRLGTHVSRIATFYGENAVPRTSAADFMSDLDTFIAERGPLQCADITDDFKAFAAQLTGEASTAIIDDLLSVPRLPVANPCL